MRYLIFALVAIGIGVAGVVVYLGRPESRPGPRPRPGVEQLTGPLGRQLAIGQPMPELEGRLLDGTPARLSDYRGQVVLLDFWATWCGPCRAMIPHEREMVERLKGRPFVLVGVSCDPQRETLEEFLRQTPLPWVHWFDGIEGPAGRALGVDVLPTLLLIDHEGILRQVWIGRPDNATLDQVVEQWVRQAELK